MNTLSIFTLVLLFISYSHSLYIIPTSMTAINFSPFIGEFSRFKLELVLWDGNSQLVDCKDLINQSKAEKISQIFQGGFQIDEFRSKNFHKARLITCDKTSAEFAQIQQSSFTSLFLDFMPLPEFGEWSFQLSFSCKSCFNCEEQQLINDSSTPCNGFAIKIPIEVSNYDEFGAYHTPSGDITVKTTTNENVGVGLGISLFVIVLLLPLLLFFIIPWWNVCQYSLQQSCPCFYSLGLKRKVKQQQRMGNI